MTGVRRIPSERVREKGPEMAESVKDRVIRIIAEQAVLRARPTCR